MSAVAVELEGPRSRGVRNSRSFLLLLLLCLPALVPLFVVLTAVFTPEVEIWSHLARYVLPVVTTNTLVLVIGVSVGAALLGTALAWPTSTCEFLGRLICECSPLLPLAMSGYVLAFIAVGFLDLPGSV